MGAVTAVNTFGASGLVSRQAGGTTTYYTYDPMGNVCFRTQGLIGSQGGTFSYDGTPDVYDAYGNDAESVYYGDPWGYEAEDGYYTDPQTGLILCGHRYYDPGHGRWLTRDPIGYAGGANLYAYCEDMPIGNGDSSGLYFGEDDAVFAAGGAVLGVAGQGVSDLMSGQVSSWQTYTGAAVGGAVGGEVLLYTPLLGGAASGAADGLASNFTTQTLNYASGNQNTINVGDIVKSTVVGGVLGAIIPGAKIEGVTEGRNSFNAIFKQITKKAQNGTIKNITWNTALKMLKGRFVDTAAAEGSLGGGALDALQRGSPCKH